MTLKEGQPLVVFGDDWGRFVSTMQHLFRHLVDRHPIVWVNSYGHRLPRLNLYDVRRAVTKAGAMMRPVRAPTPGASPAIIVQPRALPWHHVKVIHRFNTRSVQRDVRRALKAVAPGQRPVLVTGTPVAEGLVGSLDELASVYFCMDDYAELPQVTPALVSAHERLLLERVDTMVATARILVEKKRPRSGSAHHLPQGVNYEHFSAPRAVPPELAHLPRPIIGFSGTLHSCCDLELIQAVSRAFPLASIVFVGMHLIDPAPVRLPNVHLLGARRYEDLPAYVQAFDVGIIPYLINDWTLAVDSLKLLEYLAAGIPVVTTALPEARKYASAVRITESHPEFVDAVGAAVSDRSDTQGAARQRLAAANTWQHRAARFLEIVEEAVAARS